MGKITLQSKPTKIIVNGEEQTVWLLDNKRFETFNASVLGLGDVSSPSKQVEAVAAVFDLSGFTNFCNQVDPQLSVPEYLTRFLDWLFNEVKQRFVRETYKEGKELWSELPFLAKFLGDGVLFLWDTEDMGGNEICNVVTSLSDIRHRYENTFYPEVKTVVVYPPNDLRCGIARGRVFSVGNGEDYVGPCINIASRLQKLSLLTFCVSRRGFYFDKHLHSKARPRYLTKCVTIKGIGENELVWVRKEEFDNLPEEEKVLFREP